MGMPDQDDRYPSKAKTKFSTTCAAAWERRCFLRQCFFAGVFCAGVFFRRAFSPHSL
jgi:hypothetical protein